MKKLFKNLAIFCGAFATFGLVNPAISSEKKDFKMPEYTLDEKSLVYDNRSIDPIDGTYDGSIKKYAFDKDKNGITELIVMKFTGPMVVENEYACLDDDQDGYLDRIMLDFENGSSKDIDGISDLEIDLNKKRAHSYGKDRKFYDSAIFFMAALGLYPDFELEPIEGHYKMEDIGALYEIKKGKTQN